MRTGRSTDVDPLHRVRQFLLLNDPQALRDVCTGDRGCSLTLDQDAVCVACDASMWFGGANVVRPDFVIATRDDLGRFVWVIVEMTVGQKRASTAHGQLQAAASLLPHTEIPTPSCARLAAIVLIPKDRSVADLQSLALPRYRVRYGKQSITPRLRRCGDDLSEVVAAAL